MFLFTSKNNIKSMDCFNNNIVIWTGKKVEIYEIVSSLRILIEFVCKPYFFQFHRGRFYKVGGRVF